MKKSYFAALLVIGVALLAARPSGTLPRAGQGNMQKDSAAIDLLKHDYHEGDKITFYMTATNKDRMQTLAYKVQANGVVKKDTDGTFYEEYGWSNLIVNNAEMALPPASLNMRQDVAIPPGHHVAMPNLGAVLPMLIGPITDFLTFYADLQVAARSGKLVHAGDHFYAPYGTPASWADGTYTILGQSSIDFDLTLKEINTTDGTATLLVRHVPPPNPQIKVPAEWMKTPVADTANNWMEVTRIEGGKYQAQVGKEIFNVNIKLSLASGQILSATMENPVEVISRDCTDAALTDCGEPARFQILRTVEIHR